MLVCCHVPVGCWLLAHQQSRAVYRAVLALCWLMRLLSEAIHCTLGQLKVSAQMPTASLHASVPVRIQAPSGFLPSGHREALVNFIPAGLSL